MRALALALGLMIALPATADAAVSALYIEGRNCPGGNKSGTAFVTRTAAGLALVTALHVVHGCDDAQVEVVDCDDAANDRVLWVIDETTPVQAASALDVAVIPIPQQLRGDFVSAVSVLSFRDGSPPLASRRRAPTWLRVPAITDRSACSDGWAFHMATPSVRSQFEHLARQAQKRDNETDAAHVARLRGYLDATARLLVYFGSTTSGASGAPIISGDNVLGVHLGGYDDYPAGWGINLTAEGLAGARFDPNAFGSWTPVSFPTLRQSSPVGLGAEDIKTAVAAEERRWEVSLSFLASATELFTGARLGVSLGFLAPVYSSSPRSPAFTFGLGVRGNYAKGSAEQPFFGPDGRRVDETRAITDEVTFDLAFALDWRRRGFELSLGGRAGLLESQSDIQELPELRGIYGLFVGVRFELPMPLCTDATGFWHCLRGFFEVEGAWERSRTNAWTYTGAGAEYHGTAQGMALGASARLGLAF